MTTREPLTRWAQVERLRREADVLMERAQDLDARASQHRATALAYIAKADEIEAAHIGRAVLCADGTPIHDFKGGTSCPACGFTGITVVAAHSGRKQGGDDAG